MRTEPIRRNRQTPRPRFALVTDKKYANPKLEKKDASQFNDNIDTAEIIQNQLRLIIPFVYGMEYKAIVEELGKKGWLANNIEDGILHRNLYSHLNGLISKELRPDTIGRFFNLPLGKWEEWDVPSTEIELLILKNQDDEGIPFRIKSINLYAFETQVCFLEILVDDWLSEETGLFECTEKGVELANQLLRGNLTRDTTMSFNLKNHFRSFTNKLSNNMKIRYFFESEGIGESMHSANRRIPNRCLLYQSLLAYHPTGNSRNTEFKKAIGKELYKIRNRKMYTYLALDEDLKINQNNPEVLQLARTTTVGASLSGIGRITIFSSKSDIGKYMYDLSREYTYFYLYLLNLHQRYALLYISETASQFPSTMDQYLERLKNKEQVNSPEDLQEKITFFKLRCDFRQVSGDVQLVRYYDLLRRNMRIEEQLSELDGEMKMLSELTSLTKLRKKEEEQKELEERKEIEQRKKEFLEEKRNRFQILVLILTTIFVTISTVADWLGIIQGFTEQVLPAFGGIIFKFYIGGISVILFALISICIYFLIMTWKNKKELDK